MTAPESGNAWDDLFADLGLPAETPQAPVEAPTPPAKELAPVPVEEPTVEAPAADEPAPHRGRRRRAPAVAAESEGASLFAQPTEPVAVATAPPEEPAAIAEPVAESEIPAGEGPAAEPGEEAAPRGRRRRRGRGRGSKGAAANAAPVEGASEAPAANEAAPAAEVQEASEPVALPDKPEETDDASRGRRGRGRGRDRRPERDDRSGAAAHQEENEETPVEIEGEQPAPAAGDDEVDDLSNWNVPTWAELIASLYRPER